MAWRRISSLLAATAIVATACGGGSTSVTSAASTSSEASQVGQPCEPGPSPDAGVDDSIDPDRRAEALVLHLTGIDELAVTEENEGEDVVYDDPNYGGVWGDFAGGWVVAVLDCSQVDPDRIAQLAGGPDAVRLIEVGFQFEELNGFQAVLSEQMGATGLPFILRIDSTLDGRELILAVEDIGELPANIGEGIPANAFRIEEGSVGNDLIEPVDPDPSPQPVGPPSSIGALDCGDSVIVEDRLSNSGQDPTDLAVSYNSSVVRVEPGDPLFWEAFDENGHVVVLMATGDDDLQDWQVWTCE